MAYEQVQKPSSSFVPVQKKVSELAPSASRVQAKDDTASEQEQMPKVSTPATDANWLMKHPMFKGNQFLQRVVAPASESESLESEENVAQRETIQRHEVGNESGALQANAVRRERNSPEETETPNETGLPDELKAGVENLSGYTLDDVRVHYNSPKPAQLQALAYTQGTEIHVALGEEKHLPHEAWHVVQQMQGRVKPTMQMKGVQINDDEGLEREADVMGKQSFTAGQDLLKKPREFRQEGEATVESSQKPLFSLKIDHKVKRDIKSNQPAQLGKSKNGSPLKEKKVFKYKPDKTQGWNQDEVQEYLAGIAPTEGPIRDFIDNYADENEGLCAGWVVLHRTNPDKLLKMWGEVSTRILEEDRSGLGRRTDEAVKMYMEAQYQFANDPENREFKAPGEEIWTRIGQPEEPKTVTNKKQEKLVKYGEICKGALAFHDEMRVSKKHVFIEIFTSYHTAQIEMSAGKLKSICETEKAGVRPVSDWNVAEQILTSAFFKSEDEQAEIRITYEGHVQK